MCYIGSCLILGVTSTNMRRSAKDVMNQLEVLRENATKLCAEHGVTVQPYGHVWWLIGNGINRVVAELAGLCRSDLQPLAIAER